MKKKKKHSMEEGPALVLQFDNSPPFFFFQKKGKKGCFLQMKKRMGNHFFKLKIYRKKVLGSTKINYIKK
jgi:hypothetical protein